MLELIFFTSSRIKTQHARYLCRDFDIKITNFKEVRANANYVEPRIEDRKRLLEESFNNAKKQASISKLGKQKPFIIEDTSVDIPALSKKYGKEYPGVDIKFWMQNTKFEDIDLELSMLGDDRTAIVRSDVLLYLPHVQEEPFHFIGTTAGTITRTENSFETNPIYPWLDNQTFNKWFIPDGESSVLSQLPIEKANLHDFRREPFEKLLELLSIKGFLTKKDLNAERFLQNQLVQNSCHFVSGLTCAGKTTIAIYLVEEHDFFHIEASDFMQEIFRENHGLDSNVKIGEFAKEILKVRPTIVAERVLKYLQQFELQNCVITGFRIVNEIEHVKNNISSTSSLAYVECSQAIRAKRRVKRQREHYQQESIEERDNRELQMGTSEILNLNELKKIKNDTDFDSFYREYEKHFDLLQLPKIHSHKAPINELPLRKLIIVALYLAREQMGEGGQYLSTTEITNEINKLNVGNNKFVNNVGRFFSQNTNFLFEVKMQKKRRKYRLSNTGVSYAKLILRSVNF